MTNRGFTKYLFIGLGLMLGSILSPVVQACTLANIDCASFDGPALSKVDPAAIKELHELWLTSGKASNRLILFDSSQQSSHPRFYVVDLSAKTVSAHLAAHGKGSDPDHDGWLDSFSDRPGSKATPRGAFKTAETYHGRHGFSLRLDGLEDRNKNARARAIVIHGADYVSKDWSPIGRSWGCPALGTEDAKKVIDQIKDGALLLIYGKD